MILTVEVTEQDIKSGWDWCAVRMMKKYGKMYSKFENKRSEHCPVAIALARTFGEKIFAETYRLTVGNVEYRTPEIVSDWMSDFDVERPIKPFSFELDTEKDIL
jgi:hypothetical protein